MKNKFLRTVLSCTTASVITLSSVGVCALTPSIFVRFFVNSWGKKS